jgi:hypothetical protein
MLQEPALPRRESANAEVVRRPMRFIHVGKGQIVPSRNRASVNARSVSGNIRIIFDGTLYFRGATFHRSFTSRMGYLMSSSELIAHWRFRVHRVQLAHYRSARRFAQLHLWLGVPAIALSTTAGTAVFATLSKKPETWVQITVGLLSVAAAVLMSLQTFLKSADLSEKHRFAGARFAHLKHRIELLAAIPPTTAEDLGKALTGIEESWAKLREESPTLPGGVWQEIEKSLTFEKHGERYPVISKEP